MPYKDREAMNAYRRRWVKRQYELNTPYAQRNREASNRYNRERYARDPEFRKKKTKLSMTDAAKKKRQQRRRYAIAKKAALLAKCQAVIEKANQRAIEALAEKHRGYSGRLAPGGRA